MSDLSITPPKRRGFIGRAFDASWNTGVKNLKRVGEAAKAPNRVGLAAAKSAYQGLKTGDVANALDSAVSGGLSAAKDSAKSVMNPYRNSTPTVSPPQRQESKGNAVREQKLKETVQGPPKSAMNQSSKPMGPPVSAMNAPDDTVLSNEDMSKQGYTLIGNKSGQKKWRKGAEMDAENQTAAAMTNANIVKSPMYRNPVKPLETEMRMVNNRPTIVQTGGDATPEFKKLQAAQARNAVGTGTKEDDDMVAASVSGDPLGRQPGQIAKLRADERAGKYQAGRRVQ